MQAATKIFLFMASTSFCHPTLNRRGACWFPHDDLGSVPAISALNEMRSPTDGRGKIRAIRWRSALTSFAPTLKSPKTPSRPKPLCRPKPHVGRAYPRRKCLDQARSHGLCPPPAGDGVKGRHALGSRLREPSMQTPFAARAGRRAPGAAELRRQNREALARN
jgi:hypothetical protein